MLVIPKELTEKIKSQAAETYPEECCGVLIGCEDNDGRHVLHLYESQNIHSDNRTRRFMIGPDDFLKAQHIARGNDAEIIGFYHSHPEHAAVPSEHDREFAWPWYLYVIVSVFNGKPSSIQGWRLHDDRSGFEQIPVDIS